MGRERFSIFLFTWGVRGDLNSQSAFQHRLVHSQVLYQLSYAHMVDRMRFELICYLVCQTSGHPKQPHSPNKRKSASEILCFYNTSHRRINNI